jgi:hypothetical protein
VLFVGVAAAQEYPLMNTIADRVIQKYQQATCEQLWQRKGKKTRRGKQPDPIAAQRSADAHRIHQQSGGSDRQQDVRLRPASLAGCGPGLEQRLEP